jgi:hypothetical protein
MAGKTIESRAPINIDDLKARVQERLLFNVLPTFPFENVPN